MEELRNRGRNLLVTAALACALLGSLAFPLSARGDETVTSCGENPNSIFVPSSAYGITATATCPGTLADGGGLYLAALGPSYTQGEGAIWQTSAPPGLTILDATIPTNDLETSYVNDGSFGQYGGIFYWSGGSTPIPPGATSASAGPFSSNYFGFLLVCGQPVCKGSAGPGVINILQISLDVRETSPPNLSSTAGLWASRGWVRGTWNLAFSGDSPSGLCGLSASFGGGSLPGTSSSRDTSTWHECSAPAVSDSVVTQGYAQGANTLKIGGWDAAGEIVGATRTVDVDNSQPTVSLSGPATAASTAGTQYVTATGSAGPSGVLGISCSVDGSAWHWYGGSQAQVPVGGVGGHQVQCVSENNADDASGNPGKSAVASFDMQIGLPTINAIAFHKIVDQLRCKRTRRHGHFVTKCHPRTVAKRRVTTITVRRHGRRVQEKRVEIVHVVVLPHAVSTTNERVRHGHTAIVTGWLGTYAGVALAGQKVDVLAAPDNGENNFSRVATVTTTSNGTWTARIPAGPSRLIEASYAGGHNLQPSVSELIQETVPAKVELLSISPRRVAWGHSIRIVGRLDGGYLPRDGALVRLRIGLGSAYTTYGVHGHVGGSGRFTTIYTFGLGSASIRRTYWFQVASLPMGNYPYAPASSRRVSVTVGGHPARKPHR